jgi:hypothetical protein
MKNLIAAIAIISLFSFGIYHLTNSAKALSDISKVMESNVVKEVIIENDTLTVLDYSLTYGTYLLSNGISVNRIIIENK